METGTPAPAPDTRAAGARPIRVHQPRAHWAVTTMLAVTIAVVILACSNPTTTTGLQTPSPAPSVTAMPNPKHMDFTTAQYCVDSTGSYQDPDGKVDLFKAANNYIADSIEAGVRANTDGFNLYVTYIDSDPAAPSGTPLTFQVPAIPAYPTLPSVSTPTPDPNVFDKGAAQASAQASATAVWNDYDAKVAAVTAQINRAKSQDGFAQNITQLRNLAKVTANDTSVWGCLYVASNRFKNAKPGAKKLVIASDMQNNSTVDVTRLDLHGATVEVIDFLCTTGAACDATKAKWTTLFAQAGVAQNDISFHDPQETKTLPLLFDQ